MLPAWPAAEQVLAERFARGEIDAEEYRHRLDVLRGSGGPPEAGPPGAGPSGAGPPESGPPAVPPVPPGPPPPPAGAG
ncbi:SHOCT domain-containing protein [Kitasatospora purpeofusca]|uniref:SHOCT domain-containing protein n=1 Tax=Kitasatospora purpeofusca TaxID=67352 RepID=UPI0038637AC0|nr:SHOCT domain-containing protein [Kitasatospora purpeofusca]